MRGGTCAALALALALLHAARARADEPATVLVLYTQSSAPAERVRAELGAAGLAAVVRPASQPGEISGELAKAARDNGAAAALALCAPAVQLWLYLYARDELSAHIPPPEAQSNDAALAIYATELVRARLLAPPELPPEPGYREATAADSKAEAAAAPRHAARTHTEPPPPSASRPSASTARSAARRALLFAELGPALLYSHGGLAPQATLSFALMARIGRALRVGLLSLIPLHSSELSATEGTSKTRFSWLGAELRGELRVMGPLHASVAGGAGVIILASESTNSAPEFLDGQVRGVSSGAYVGGGAVISLTSALALRLDGRIGALLNPFVIEYGLRPVARWGQPWLAATLDLQWYFY